MERVNHNKRQRCHGARDKEELMKKIKHLRDKGYSQVDIAIELNMTKAIKFEKKSASNEQNKYL